MHRPAAADQLETLGSEIEVPVYRGDGRDAVAIASASIQQAVDNMNDIVIVDTAGRLQIDEEMMQEAVAIKQAVKPDQILMVVDAMTGQDIVNVVTTFAERVDFDGVIMSKLDGDARGGGALSVREVTGKPIKFVSMGEKPDSLEVFIRIAWQSAFLAWAMSSPSLSRPRKMPMRSKLRMRSVCFVKALPWMICSLKCSRFVKWAVSQS